MAPLFIRAAGSLRLDPSLGGAHTELLFCVDLPSPALGVDADRALSRAVVDQVGRRRVTDYIGAIRYEFRRRLALSRLMARDDELPRAGGKKRLAAYLRRRMLGGSNASEEPDREDKSQRHHDGILHRHGAYHEGSPLRQPPGHLPAPDAAARPGATRRVVDARSHPGACAMGRAARGTGMRAAQPRAGAGGSCWALCAQRDYVALAPRAARQRHQA